MTTDTRQHTAVLLEPDQTEAPARLTRPALLMVEGTVTDSSGTQYTYSARHLKRIAKATTDYINSGERVIFTKDHGGVMGDYKADDIMGSLDRVWVAKISEDNIPHEGMADLVGKTGLYGQITIAGQENIIRYQDGRMKSISVGIDIGGDFIAKDVIFEVSAVWKGAIRGASLFGLTLDGTIAERQSQRFNHDDELAQLLMRFADTTQAIRGTTEAELNGRDRPTLLSNAIDDLEIKLRDHLGAARSLPPAPTFSKGGNMTTEDKNTTRDEPGTESASAIDVATYQKQIETLTASVAELQAQNELLKLTQERIERQQQTRAQWDQLRERAHALCTGDQPRLTPAAFKQWFGATADEAQSLVVRYAKPIGDADALNLATVEAVISHLEQHGQPVTTMGSVLADEPLDDREGSDSAKVEVEVATLRRMQRSKGLTVEQTVAKLGTAVSAAAIAQFKGGN